MKRYFLLIFLFIGFTAAAQKSSTLQQLQIVYTTGVAWEEPGELTFDAQAKTIALKNFRVPVSQDTQVKRQKNTVIFMLQRNTTVTDVNDPSFKRAYFELPFRTRDEAASFVNYFRDLSAGK